MDTSLAVLDEYESLNKVIRASFDEQQESFSKYLRSPGFVTKFHLIIVTFLTFLIAPATFIPVFGSVLCEYLNTFWGISDFIGIVTILNTLIFAVWIIVVVIPPGVVRSKKQWIINTLNLIKAILIMPIYWVLAVIIMSILNQSNPTLSGSILLFFVFVFFSFSALPFIWGMLFIISPFILPIRYFVPVSLATLINEAHKKALAIVQARSSATNERVYTLAQYRRDAINSQGQAFSFLLASVGLIGLLGLVITGEEIIQVLSQILSFLSQQPDTPPINATRALFVLFALGLVILAAVYFVSTYRDLLAIEVIVRLCKLQSMYTQIEPLSVPPTKSLPLTQQSTSLQNRISVMLFVLGCIYWLFIRRTPRDK
ncbi:MAG: hypothetical protein HC876_15525 [Chloroflexaceae bacterium]|nr:hypothetical protein [Chloroflexaceae bacterium]NJO06808.1 hypothetical protein [Chloroflexaceae bacterium]